MDCPVRWSKLIPVSQVLSGNKPYFDCKDSLVLLKLQAGEMPQRPYEGINDQAWELLEKCWSRDPGERPPTLGLYNALSNVASDPQVTHTPQGQTVLPKKLRLQVHGLKLTHDKPNKGMFYVMFVYGNVSHATQLMNASGERIWFALRPRPLVQLRLNPAQEQPGKLANENQ